MMIKAIEWMGGTGGTGGTGGKNGGVLRLLDQTRLPGEEAYIYCTTPGEVHDAIRRLVVRGAPAIGVAAAYGAYLGIQASVGTQTKAAAVLEKLREVCAYLATSRPTAVNLFWALDRIRTTAEKAAKEDAGADVLAVVLAECGKMYEEDARVCRDIGRYGLELLMELAGKSGVGGVGAEGRPLTLLTHCNAGGLATVAYGTALAPMYLAKERGMKVRVFADETRPLLQGSRITAFELMRAGIDVTVQCDSMAAALLSGGHRDVGGHHDSEGRPTRVDAVIVGTDRVAANGDVANKIGTYGLAILARHFGVPFVVASPLSTIDLKTASGKEIPIEQRKSTEVTDIGGRVMAPEGVKVFNPAFDVTPAELVTAIVTEKGVIRPVNEQEIRKMVAGS